MLLLCLIYTFVCYRNNMKIKFDKNSAKMMRGFSDHLPLYFLLCCYQVKTCVILQWNCIVRKVCRKRSVAARWTLLFSDEGLVWPNKVGTGDHMLCLMETNSQVFLEKVQTHHPRWNLVYVVRVLPVGLYPHGQKVILNGIQGQTVTFVR